jgi:hypothetical protein
MLYLHFDKIFSDNQARQVAIKNRRFDSRLGPHMYMEHAWLSRHISSLMMRTETAPETSICYCHLTQLIAREDFNRI